MFLGLGVALLALGVGAIWPSASSAQEAAPLTPAEDMVAPVPRLVVPGVLGPDGALLSVWGIRQIQDQLLIVYENPHEYTYSYLLRTGVESGERQASEPRSRNELDVPGQFAIMADSDGKTLLHVIFDEDRSVVDVWLWNANVWNWVEPTDPDAVAVTSDRPMPDYCPGDPTGEDCGCEDSCLALACDGEYDHSVWMPPNPAPGVPQCLIDICVDGSHGRACCDFGGGYPDCLTYSGTLVSAD